MVVSVDSQIIKNFLDALNEYFVYLYPGFITLVIYYFSLGKNLKENKYILIKSVIISYLYISFSKVVIEKNFLKNSKVQNMVLLVLAIGVPLIWNALMKTKLFTLFLRKIGIRTDIYDSIMDSLRFKEKDGVWVRVFLDDKGVMYEGSLRLYEKDTKKKQQIVLSGYRYFRIDAQTKEEIIIENHENDSEYWVKVLEKDITRMEFKYQHPHPQ